MKTYKGQTPILRLVRESSFINKVKITSSMDVNEFARSCYSFENDDIDITESVYAIFLNKANNTIGYKQLSSGGTDGCLIDIKIVAKLAIECLCNAIILVHNHPSGNSKASVADIRVSEKIRAGLKLLDIQMLDHIIIAGSKYLSLSDEGLI